MRRALLTVALAATALALTACDNDPPEEDSRAVHSCISEVRSQIKASPTVKFWDWPEVSEEPGEIRRVLGTFEAENLYGALLEGRYRCVVETGGYVVELHIDDLPLFNEK